MKLFKINLFLIVSLIFFFAVIIVVTIYFNNNNLLNELKEREAIIVKSCKVFDINSRLYASIIYGELKNNLDQLDKLDDIRAKLGFDPSVGFAQLRVSTAKWIEDNYSDNIVIKKSKNRSKLVENIISDSTNILYTAFYIWLINKKLSEKFAQKPTIRMLASYYGKGIDNDFSNHPATNYYNQIGTTAEEFYYSNDLIDVFPR